MTGTPTLYQLFRRSRYSRPMDLVPGSSQNNQVEVFAVAALGFTLRHDPSFLFDFLSIICRFSKSEIGTPEDYEIRCQDGEHADLAIILPKRYAIVVEAKIGASLDDHQNPSLADFNQLPKGYGHQIKTKLNSVRERYYLVLMRDCSNYKMKIQGSLDPMFLGFHEWNELSGIQKKSNLTIDFLTTLGYLGIPEMNLQNLKGNVENDKASTAKMLSILHGLARLFKIPTRNSLWDFRFSKDEGSYVGINIPRDGIFTVLSKCIGPTKKIIGWFGYENPSGGKGRLSVWLYPEDSTKSELKKTKQFVSKRTGSKVEMSDSALYVVRDDSSVKDDVSWLQETLLKLADSRSQS